MPWNSNSPVGLLSVKDNRPSMNENTVYIETTMGNSVVGTNTTSTRDHFWNVGSNEDGRHRFFQSVGFTVGGSPENPVLGTGMDGVIYLKTASSDINRVEGFYRNTSGIYQFIPSFLSGTASITSSSTYQDIVAIPANVYGEIFMYTTALGKRSGVSGAFRSNGSVVEGWMFSQGIDSTSSDIPLKLANGSNATNLTLKARRSDAGSATWNYRITYRAL